MQVKFHTFILFAMTICNDNNYDEILFIVTFDISFYIVIVPALAATLTASPVTDGT